MEKNRIMTLPALRRSAPLTRLRTNALHAIRPKIVAKNILIDIFGGTCEFHEEIETNNLDLADKYQFNFCLAS